MEAQLLSLREKLEELEGEKQGRLQEVEILKDSLAKKEESIAEMKSAVEDKGKEMHSLKSEVTVCILSEMTVTLHKSFARVSLLYYQGVSFEGRHCYCRFRRSAPEILSLTHLLSSFSRCNILSFVLYVSAFLSFRPHVSTDFDTACSAPKVIICLFFFCAPSC